jgi:UDP-N-acetylglucosamine 2-epimerase (non-hydrolysing)
MEFLRTQNDKYTPPGEHASRKPPGLSSTKVLVLFGTRPEAIKLAPLIHELNSKQFETIVVSSGQHTDLLLPFLSLLKIQARYNLEVMTADQSPNQVLSRTLLLIDEIISVEKPDLIMVQGDTATTLAGAMAGFNRKVPVAHIEAGLRSGDRLSPFPEEMNRRLVSRLAAFHFCATEANRRNLLAEGVPETSVFVTGNTVVDSLNFILKTTRAGKSVRNLIAETKGKRRILLTTHRRESFGGRMGRNLRDLRQFVEKHEDVCVIFPVHPNPNVRKQAERHLEGLDRIYLIDPLAYNDFVALMKSAWLIVSDSGGVQEEAPSMGKPLLVLRENTERPEALSANIARLVGKNSLAKMLEENYNNEAWIKSVRQIANPFGDGTSAQQIVHILESELLPAFIAAPKKLN